MADDRTAVDPWMLRADRHERIVRLLSGGTARVGELAARLGVSAMTIRRDADDLVAAGLVERVHGGVRAARRPSAEEPPPTAKAALRTGEKERIAAAVRTLVAPGSAVGIGAGTTMVAVAAALADVPSLTIVTNAIPVAQALATSRATVILLGGERTPSDALVGPIANQAAAGLSLDVLVLGSHAVDAEHGCTTPNLREAETNRALLRAARQRIVAADASKWGERGLATFAALDELDVLVTDRSLPAEARRAAAARVGRLIAV